MPRDYVAESDQETRLVGTEPPAEEDYAKKEEEVDLTARPFTPIQDDSPF
jgi:hypothetical protein